MRLWQNLHRDVIFHSWGMNSAMIPKIIHFCWLSDDPYPASIRKCIASWKEKLPDYEIWKWDFNRFPKGTAKWVDQAFEKKKYAFAADYIRLYALSNYGGIYLDSDVEVLKSFDDLLHLPYFLGAENTPKGIEAATLGCEKHWNLIDDLYNRYKDMSFIAQDNSLRTLPMPAIFRKCIESNYDLHYIQNQDEFDYSKDVVNVFPVDWFSPKNWDSHRIRCTKNTYSIHHFAASWKTRNFSQRKKEVVNKAKSLIRGVFAPYKLGFFLSHPYSIVSNVSLGRYYYNSCNISSRSPFTDAFLYDDDFFNLVEHLSAVKDFKIHFIRSAQSKYKDVIDDYFSIASVENLDIELHFRNLDSRKLAQESWDKGLRCFHAEKAKCIYVKADVTQEELDRLSKASPKILLVTNRETEYPYQLVVPTLTKQNEKTRRWLNGRRIRTIIQKVKSLS